MPKNKKTKPDFSKAKIDETELLDTSKKFLTDKKYKNTPTVVIVGRPNVGKSTLFNRFMKKKVAITDPTPGVTRDPVIAQVFVNEKPITLIDTGGYKLERVVGSKEAELDELVVQKSIEMLERADLILLLLEAGNITGEDEELITTIRPYSKRVVLVVNKTEGGRNIQDAWNYARFGFRDLQFISAEHGDHLADLFELVEKKLDFSKVEEDTNEEPIRIAILGKPNTGKSTLSNRLTHTQSSIVSDYAGTTRDVVEGEFIYKEKLFKVLDTAGIRKKTKVQEDVEYYSVNRAIKTLDNCDVVFLMIDVNHGLTEQDKKICALATERGRGTIFVLNKWDTQEDQSKKALKAIIEDIHIMFGKMEYAPIVAISALEGKGIIELLNTSLELYEQLKRKVETSALNIALDDWLTQYPPPASKTSHFKIRYMTQISVNPVKFLIFATRPEVVPDTYITYLKNRIRADLGFEKIPVQLELKASRTSWEKRKAEIDKNAN